ncbi:helix-turn-helix domain-containing protein [Streptomyces sp. P5-A9]|uniref:helix-turn-helix domain-containing protein n=1 Tax=Streptomyces sp. P5-A9 TaxID=3071730 RepID=UPI002FCA734B
MDDHVIVGVGWRPPHPAAPIRAASDRRRARGGIFRGIAAGESARQLAGRLGRSPSTVSREVAAAGTATVPRPPTHLGAGPIRVPSSPNGLLCARWWKPTWLCTGLPSRSQDGCGASAPVTPR